MTDNNFISVGTIYRIPSKNAILGSYCIISIWR